MAADVYLYLSSSRFPTHHLVPRSVSTLFHAAVIYISARQLSRVTSSSAKRVRASLRALRVKHPVLKDGGGYGIVSILMVLTDVDTQIRDCYCFLN
jgi:hypothetical protein